jgi:hypothetical protein
MLVYHERFSFDAERLGEFYSLFMAQSATFHPSYRQKIVREYMAAASDWNLRRDSGKDAAGGGSAVSGPPRTGGGGDRARVEVEAGLKEKKKKNKKKKKKKKKTMSTRE